MNKPEIDEEFRTKPVEAINEVIEDLKKAFDVASTELNRSDLDGLKDACMELILSNSEARESLATCVKHLESERQQLIDALGKLLKVSKSEVPEKYRNEYENVWEKSETALRDAGRLS